MSIAIVVGSRDQPLILLDFVVTWVILFDVLLAGGTQVLVITHRHGGFDGAIIMLQLLCRVAKIEVNGARLTGGRGIKIDDLGILHGDIRVVLKGICQPSACG